MPKQSILWQVFKGYFTWDILYFYFQTLETTHHFQSFFSRSSIEAAINNSLDSSFLSIHNIQISHIAWPPTSPYIKEGINILKNSSVVGSSEIFVWREAMKGMKVLHLNLWGLKKCGVVFGLVGSIFFFKINLRITFVVKTLIL